MSDRTNCPKCGVKAASVAGFTRSRKCCTPEERFWGRVQKTDTCWLYTGAKDQTGYGYLHNPLGKVPRYTTAHRYSWVLANGPVPAGLHVLHKCDVHACCNPAHLFVGTAKDNMADCAAKGRSTRGERNRQSRLTDEQVREIRRDFVKVSTCKTNTKELAARYGVGIGAISAITRGDTWKHLL